MSATNYQQCPQCKHPSDEGGTFYAEKGSGTVADRPYLCAKKADNTYGWLQLATIP